MKIAKVLILVVIFGLMVVYIFYSQWKLELAEAKVNVYAGIVERRNDKIADLEYEIYSYQEAMALKCGFSGTSAILR